MKKLLMLDKPQNPEIEINQDTNAEVPQAWEYEWNWYYNWLWAVKEAEYRWLHLPSNEEFDFLKDELKKLNQLNSFRGTSGSFYDLDSDGYWWSSTESVSNAWTRYFVWSFSPVYRVNVDKGIGFSVVCTEKPL